jgi:hypothetical protein
MSGYKETMARWYGMVEVASKQYSVPRHLKITRTATRVAV